MYSLINFREHIFNWASNQITTRKRTKIHGYNGHKKKVAVAVEKHLLSPPKLIFGFFIFHHSFVSRWTTSLCSRQCGQGTSCCYKRTFLVLDSLLVQFCKITLFINQILDIFKPNSINSNKNRGFVKLSFINTLYFCHQLLWPIVVSNYFILTYSP